MGSLPQDLPASHHHRQVLEEVLVNRSAEETITRHYQRSFSAFAAKLTEAEKDKLTEKDGVVSIFPSRTYELTTTRSWDFMGFPINIKRDLAVESDVIIGVIDTGIWPESESFKDDGIGSIPKKWKGVCAGGENFTCNRKLIGARYYNFSLHNTARDFIGHGSHTASTAAGRMINNASFYGIAAGKARGGVPSARIAAYSVCGKRDADGRRCGDRDILNAFDDAIADGVDIITISIGATAAVGALFRDPIAIGSFHAIEKGILTVQSAGNEGPSLSSTSSLAPWLLSVAASTTDQRIVDKVVLGNGSVLVGASINTFTTIGQKEFVPLVSGLEASIKNCSNPVFARSCAPFCINKTLVKDKLLMCQASTALLPNPGALGVIGMDHYTDHSSIVPYPQAAVRDHHLHLMLAYGNSTKHPVASLSKSEAIKVTPVVANFSSRGPNPIIPEILKPDVSAPGVEILAAYSPLASLDNNEVDKRRVSYSILSGTSMACPHAAGTAAYLKSLHPDWSPSAIKSAIMTTAWPFNYTSSEFAEFGSGAGHINPVKAAQPGLVYEINTSDYIDLLCTMYDPERLKRIAGHAVTCPDKGKNLTEARILNYPSITVAVNRSEPFSATFPRTVTNVGGANATYRATLKKLPGLTIQVEPGTLHFHSPKEKRTFLVTVHGRKVDAFQSTTLVWSDGYHTVKSPIVVYLIKAEDQSQD